MPRMVTLSIATIIAIGLLAAQKPDGPQPKAGSVSAGAKKNSPGPTAKSPSARIGESIVQVIDRLVAAGAAKGKGEFETTDEYEARQMALAGQFATLAFLLPKDSSFDTAPFVYDADHAEMQVHIRALTEYFSANDNLTEVKSISLARRNTGSSSRTDAHGRRVRVDTLAEYGITISPRSSIPFDSQEPYVNNILPSTATFAFPLTVTQARTLKPFLRAVVVGRLDNGSVHRESDTDPQFGDYSYELKRTRLSVQFCVEEIQVVDVRTGEQVKVVRPNEDRR